MNVTDFDSIRVRNSLAEYCQKRGIELRRNGTSGQLVGLCPLHQEKTPSFHVYQDDNHFYCFGCGAHGDVTDLEQALGGGTVSESAARLGAERLPTCAKLRSGAATISRAQKIETKRPDLSCLRKASRAELKQIADSRNIDPRAVELAQDLGTLRVGEVCGYLSWVLLDASGLCAEGRRLNRKPYPAVTTDKVQLSERKAHRLRGSRKDWPVGIMPAASYRKSFDVICLVEGGPDLLSVIHFALNQPRIGIMPVAILGRGVCRHGLHPDSLEHFRGHRIRIYPHDDPDGGAYKNALLWARQLEKLDCEVDCFVFKGLVKLDGSRVKDLNDCTELAPEHAHRLEVLFP